ncbi:MAG TPA: ABC transporter substrate-binding protein [Stellaceae bacterium]|nr:ABC transporter substrate-binding protein [Stellaceae bacterium]
MERLSRRSILHASLGLAAAGPLVRPYVAKAAATTATAWWAQGFIPDEDAALRKAVADYKKASGNTIELSIIPFAPLRQKIISAITSGVVPDLIDATPAEVTPEQAWAGRLVDVGDVVATQKAKMVPTAPESALCYDGVEKKHAYYGVPYKCSVRPFHIWGDLVEKAGYKRSDIPDRWDPFIDFFKPIQHKLRDQGMRHVYATGLVVSTIGGDPVSTFDQFLLAYGGENTVTKDGKLHADDPQVKEAAIKALEKLTSLFKEGYIPPGSVNWNDADDNNAFHAKLCVMDLDGTLSTEVAMIHNRKAYYEDMMTYAPPLSNAGKKVPSVFPVNLLLVPKGAKNVEVAKDFAKYLIEPKVNGEYLKGGLGRYLPVFPELVKNDPFWLDPKVDPHRPPYVEQGLVNPTIPYFYVYNPAYAQVETEHVWEVAQADIVSGGMKVQDAADKAWKRIEAIFAKDPIAEG